MYSLTIIRFCYFCFCYFSARAYVIGLGCIAWSVGNCTLPLFGWAIARWKWIKVVCTVPAIIMYLTYFIVPESPRWLVSQGRMEDAKEVLTKIAKTNKSKIPEDIEVNYIYIVFYLHSS